MRQKYKTSSNSINDLYEEEIKQIAIIIKVTNKLDKYCNLIVKYKYRQVC